VTYDHHTEPEYERGEVGHREGTWVEATYRAEREWHPALVMKQHFNGTYMLRYGEDLVDDCVQPANIRATTTAGAQEYKLQYQHEYQHGYQQSYDRHQQTQQTDVSNIFAGSGTGTATARSPVSGMGGELGVEEGDLVDAHVGGDKWVRGVVLAVHENNGFVTIRFSNGVIDHAVPVQVLRMEQRWMQAFSGSDAGGSEQGRDQVEDQEEDDEDEDRDGEGGHDEGTNTNPSYGLESLTLGASLGAGTAEAGLGMVNTHHHHRETTEHLGSIKGMLEKVLDSLQWEMVREKLDAHTENVADIMRGHHEEVREALRGHHETLEGHHDKMDQIHTSHGKGTGGVLAPTASSAAHATHPNGHTRPHDHHNYAHGPAHGPAHAKKHAGNKHVTHTHGHKRTQGYGHEHDHDPIFEFFSGEVVFVTHRAEITGVHEDGTFSVEMMVDHEKVLEHGVTRDMLMHYVAQVSHAPPPGDVTATAAGAAAAASGGGAADLLPELEDLDRGLSPTTYDVHRATDDGDTQSAQEPGRIRKMDSFIDEHEQRHGPKTEQPGRIRKMDTFMDEHEQRHGGHAGPRGPGDENPHQDHHSHKAVPPPATSSGAAGVDAASLGAGILHEHEPVESGKGTTGSPVRPASAPRSPARKGSHSKHGTGPSPLDVLDENDPLMKATKSRRRHSSVASISLDIPAFMGKKLNKRQQRIEELAQPRDKRVLSSPDERPVSAGAVRKGSIVQVPMEYVGGKKRTNQTKQRPFTSNLADAYDSALGL